MSLVVDGTTQPTPAQMAQTSNGGPSGDYPSYLTFQKVANGDTHTVRDAQEYLTNHGYNVGGIDGIWGPNTARALKAYLSGVHPNAHNARQQAIANRHPQTGRFQPQPKGGGGNNRNLAVKGGKGGKGGGGNVANVAPPSGAFNPKKAAQAMANQEYNPAINSLKQALLDLATQGKYDQGQIKGYYGQMSNLMKSQSNEQNANEQAALQNVTGDMGNVAQLFGASNAQQMQPAVGNATGLLGAEGQSEKDYLSNMLPLLQAQAAQGNQNIDNLVMAQQRNYNNQLTQQQQAKGAAYNADYQQALSDQATQEQNALALQQAQAMMPYQIGSAKAQLKVDRANANAAGAINQAKIRASQAQAQHYRALDAEAQSTIAKNMAEAKKAATAAGGANVLAPGSTTFNRIQAGLYKAMTNSSGKITIPNPIQAQHALFAEAVAQGLITRQGKPLVKGAIKLLNSTLVNMYQRDAQWQKGFRWNGTQFVPR